MMTLLRSLHTIAAQRGDGLCPELLNMVAPSPAWAGLERMEHGIGVAKGARLDGGAKGNGRSAEIVVLAAQKRA